MTRSPDERMRLLMQKASEIRSEQHLKAVLAMFPEEERPSVFAKIREKLPVKLQEVSV